MTDFWASVEPSQLEPPALPMTGGGKSSPGFAAGVGYGTLTDYMTGEPIGPASPRQAEYAAAHGQRDTGTFTIDQDCNPQSSDADPAVFGPLRTVYISGGPE